MNKTKYTILRSWLLVACKWHHTSSSFSQSSSLSSLHSHCNNLHMYFYYRLACLVSQHPLTRISVIGRAKIVLSTRIHQGVSISVTLALKIVVPRGNEDEEDFAYWHFDNDIDYYTRTTKVELTNCNDYEYEHWQDRL